MNERISVRWVFGFLLCFSGLSVAEPMSEEETGLRQLKARLFEYSLYNPDPKNIRAHMASLCPDGRWPDINYQDDRKSGWEPGIHLQERTSPMAQAYSNPENELYQNPELREKVLLAFDFWLRSEFENPRNFWWNGIGIPREIGGILLLLESELTLEQVERGLYLMDYEVRYKAEYNKTEVPYWYNKAPATGQNKVWLIRIHLIKAVFRNQTDKVRQCFASVAEELTLNRPGRWGFNEGIQADFSFHQHGPQLSSGSYGHAFAKDSARFLALSRGTPFEFISEERDFVTHYFLGGIQWMVYNGMFDYGAMGRSITRKNMYDRGAEFLEGCEYMLMLNSPQQDELETFAAQLRKEKEQTLRGHRYFWCSDFSVHRRENYYISVKMNSTRTLGTETGNGEGLKNYYVADGCSYVFLRGNEYNNIFPVWDWSRIPGVTCEFTTETPKLKNWGDVNGETFAARGETSFVGGVSDGMYGLVAMNYRKAAVSARKAWFCFEDEVVCLGSGISANTTNPVITSVNQCLLLSQNVLVDGVEAERGEWVLENPKWVFHNGVGYVFPDPADIRLKNEMQNGTWQSINNSYSNEKITKEVFSLWINHGVNPVDQSYRYIVLPDIDPVDLSMYAENSAIDVLNNTSQLQVVCHRAAGITQAAFYEAGEISLECGGFLRVNWPCLLMICRRGDEVKIAVSNPENKPLSVQVEASMNLTGSGCIRDVERNLSVITFDLPGGHYAGQSIVKSLQVDSLGL